MKTLIIITITLFLLLIGIVVYFLTKKINNNLECKNNCSNNDIHNTSIQISKVLYNIILSIDNNYKLKNEKIVLWLS